MYEQSYCVFKESNNYCNNTWDSYIRWVILKVIFLSIMLCLGISCHPEKSSQSDIINPKLVNSHTALRYPAEAYQQNYQGKVVISILVGIDGKVVKSQIYESSGYEILDQAALEMAKISMFEPGKVNGAPKELWVRIPFEFKLNNESMAANEIDTWRAKTEDYFLRLSTDSADSQDEIVQNLFYHYQSMANYIGVSRTLQANKLLLNFVDGDIQKQWVDFEKIWPLGFLLYLDYQVRFPNTPLIAVSEEELIKYLNQDLKLLEAEKPPPLMYAELYQSLSGLLKGIYNRQMVD